MINGGYLIPANTKKGQLIFGIFTTVDLMLFGTGVGISIILLLAIGASETINAIVCLIPALVCGFLVLPIPNYRNVRNFIVSAYQFLTNQRISDKIRPHRPSCRLTQSPYA